MEKREIKSAEEALDNLRVQNSIIYYEQDKDEIQESFDTLMQFIQQVKKENGHA